MHHEYFPEEVLALQQELKKHPEILAKIEGKDLAESLAIIGAELHILLDGLYTPLELCTLFLRKLKEQGALVITADPQLVEARIKISKDSIVIEEQPVLKKLP